MALFVLAVIAGCGASAPEPSPVRTALFIDPATTVLKIDETEQFSVLEQMSDGTSRPVNAIWTCDNPQVVVVTTAGQVTAVGVGAATLSAAAEGGHLARELQVVVDITGTYEGQFRTNSCQRQSGSGPSPCVAPTLDPLTLTVTQTHDVVTGNMKAYQFYSESGPLSGRVTAGGIAALSATLTGQAVTTISDWQARITGARLEGQFVITQQFTNVFGPQVLLERAELVNVFKQ